MTIQEFVTMRKSQQARNDFLEWLLHKERKAIALFSRRMLGSRANQDFIRGEASQAFLLAANKAIDKTRIEDDGRGKHDPIAWIRFKALRGVLDFIRIEYSLHSHHSYPQKKFENSVLSLLQAHQAEGSKSVTPSPFICEDFVISAIMLEPIMERITEIDRDILDVLFIKRKEPRISRVTLRVAREFKCSERFIMQRIAKMRRLVGTYL